MWLITTLIAAITATFLWFLLKKKHKLGFLSLMLWGSTIMILVDHVLGYGGGKLLEIETDGMIKNGIMLGIAMLIPVFLIWFAILFISNNTHFFKPLTNLNTPRAEDGLDPFN